MKAAIFILSLAAAMPARAVSVVDQSTLLAPAQSTSAFIAGVISRPSGPNLINSLVQTITAGLSGRLTRIDLQAYNGGGTGGVSFTLFDGDGSLSTARAVFNQYVPLTSLPTSSGAINGTLLTFDLSQAAFDVAAGQLFSFRLDPANPLTQPGRIALITGAGPADGNPPPPIVYPGGELKVSAGGAFVLPGRDGAFQTFVDPAIAAAVPEPATWAVMIGGIGMAGGAMRRSRTKVRTDGLP